MFKLLKTKQGKCEDILSWLNLVRFGVEFLCYDYPLKLSFNAL